MVYLNDDIREARKKLLGAVGKLNKALEYTGYKNEQTGEYVPLRMNEFSSDEIVDIYKLLNESISLASEGKESALLIKRTLESMRLTTYSATLS